ncbi:helix-turn-helix domain-containing protein [Fulvivirgaceae bacterium BMA12]|uniref:Helix-turn-helix domain-containing protein n=1 Tax=Agaribacillus aureus TaxID=3051825 RepID=A0ABT8L2G9_9BACT|nr:helix-turn-helix domain-containing protein [Fulvivirgaceae bacterium BMA12]
MKINEQIRHLYQPIQPTIRQSDKNVTYQEFLPDQHLQQLIYCYWQLKTTKPLSNQFNYKVVADGCIDIFFELNNPEESFVMGFCKKYTEFRLDNNFNYVGIRFLPTMFPQIFGINAADLSNRFENLDSVLPETSKFITRHFHHQLTSEQIKATFDGYFLSLMAKVDFDIDNRLYEAMNIILSNFGVINIEKDLDTGISPRQLQRLFKYYIGDTAKTFSKVVQFQNILKAKPSRKSLKENKLFYDIGYYDQSHFIKDFKNFYGVTPTRAFRG